MRKNEKKSIFSLGPNGPILQIFLVVQYLVGSLKIPSDGSNNLIFLDQVKKHCDVVDAGTKQKPCCRCWFLSDPIIPNIALSCQSLTVLVAVRLLQ